MVLEICIVLTKGGDTVTLIEQTGRPFLPKPFVPDDLKAVVRETLRQLEK